jgi:hypothetical protein
VRVKNYMNLKTILKKVKKLKVLNGYQDVYLLEKPTFLQKNEHHEAIIHKVNNLIVERIESGEYDEGEHIVIVKPNADDGVKVETYKLELIKTENAKLHLTIPLLSTTLL